MLRRSSRTGRFDEAASCWLRAECRSRCEQPPPATSTKYLVAVVEVVPLVAGTAPVIVGGGVVGAVVSVLGLLVQGAGLGVLDERLGVKVGGLLSVQNSAHLLETPQTRQSNPKTPTPHDSPVQFDRLPACPPEERGLFLQQDASRPAAVHRAMQ